LNDASLTFELETSQAWFRLSLRFPGLVAHGNYSGTAGTGVQSNVITTVPNVSFVAYTTKGEKVIVNNPTEMPPLSKPTDRGTIFNAQSLQNRLHW
jgi:GTP-binding protein LepA